MEDESKSREELLQELSILRLQIAELRATEDERSLAEKALRERSDHLQALIEHSLDNVAVLNADGTTRFRSPSLGQVLGYESTGEVGISALDFLHPDERSIADQTLEQLRNNPGTPVHMEFRARHGDGTWHTLEVVLRNLLHDPIVGGILANFRDISERKLAEESRLRHVAALARTEELQRSRQRIVTIQESLRREIAQQLHGTVQNRLIILMHRLTELKNKSPNEEMESEIQDLYLKLMEIMENQVRPISHRLYPSILRRGLVASLQSLADQFEATLNIETELDEIVQRRERGDPRFIPEQVRLSAYRIVEEALTNALKHAGESKVTIRLKTLPEGWLHLRVEDDGPGFEAGDASSSLGTLMMQDYAEMVGGNCIIRSTPGKGCEVVATLPLAEPGGPPP